MFKNEFIDRMVKELEEKFFNYGAYGEKKFEAGTDIREVVEYVVAGLESVCGEMRNGPEN